MLKIAIIDSGAGGLSILSELLRRNLNCRTVYLADLKQHPYGTLEEESLKFRVVELIDKLIQKESPDLCVVACNTASTLVLPFLRERWAIPFVGVVPAIKPAVAESSTHCIGVLATPGTIARQYLDELIAEFAKDSIVLKYGSERLVAVAENYVQTGFLDTKIVREEINKLTIQNTRMDVVVLACTHFPLLGRALHTVSVDGIDIRFIDSTNAIVNRIEQLLPDIKQSRRNLTQNCLVLNTEESKLASYAQFVSKSADIKDSSVDFEFAHLVV